MKVIDSEGKLFDLDKGDFVRDESGEIITPEPPTYRSEEVPKLDEDFDAFRTFYLQPTWALNSALFALPDTAVSAVGRAFGVKDEDIFSFTEFFNPGQDAPKNRSERYASAIGDSIGTVLPFSGILGWFAGSYKKANDAYKVLKNVPEYRFLGKDLPVKGYRDAIRAASKDVLDYTRKNPIGAVGLDIAFGAGYGGLKQTIDETLDEGTFKDYAMATLPVTSIPLLVGTTLGATALSKSLMGLYSKVSPGVGITKEVLSARAKKNGTSVEEEGLLAGLSNDTIKELREDPLTKELIAEREVSIPVLKQIQQILNNLMGKEASTDINKAFEFLTIQKNKDETFSEAFAMDELNKLLKFIDNHPNLKGTQEGETIKDKIQFSFDLAQGSLSAEINNTKKAFESKLPAKFLRMEKGREARNIEALLDMYKRLSPEAKKPYIEAVNIARTQHERMINELSEKVGSLGEGELKRLAQKFGGQTIDDIGDSLRKGLQYRIGQITEIFLKRAENIGAKRTEPTGIASRTRDSSLRSPDEFQAPPLPGVQVAPFSKFVQKLIEDFPKFNIFDKDVKASGEQPTGIFYHIMRNFDQIINDYYGKMKTGIIYGLDKDGEVIPGGGIINALDRTIVLPKGKVDLAEGALGDLFKRFDPKFKKSIEKEMQKEEAEPMTLLEAIIGHRIVSGGFKIIGDGASIAPEIKNKVFTRYKDPADIREEAARYIFDEYFKRPNFKEIKTNTDRLNQVIKNRDLSLLYYPKQETIDNYLKSYFKKEQITQEDLIPKIDITFPDAFRLLGQAQMSLNETRRKFSKIGPIDFGRDQNALKQQEDLYNRLRNFVGNSFKDSKEIQTLLKDYDDTFSNIKSQFVLSGTGLAKSGLEFSTSNEAFANSIFKNVENLKTMNSFFKTPKGHATEYINSLEQALLHRMASKENIENFVTNPESFKKALDGLLANKKIFNNLPEALKKRLQNYDSMLTKTLQKRENLRQQIQNMEQNSFMRATEKYFGKDKSVPENAYMGDLIAAAFRDPNLMRNLAKAQTQVTKQKQKGFGKAEVLDPLKVEIFNFVKQDLMKGFDDPESLLKFVTHPKIQSTLKQVFTPSEIKNLEMIAEAHRRVYSSGPVQGRAFAGAKAFDDRFKEMFGFGVQTLESSARAAFITQKMSVSNALTFLGARLLSKNQIALYDALLYRALSDPKFAQKLLNVRGEMGSPDYMKKVESLVATVGGNLKEALRTREVPKVQPDTFQKGFARPIAADVLAPEETQEFPITTKPQAQTQPSLPSMNVVRPQAPSQRSPEFLRSYEALFPDDPIVPMLKRNQPPQR